MYLMLLPISILTSLSTVAGLLAAATLEKLPFAHIPAMGADCTRTTRNNIQPSLKVGRFNRVANALKV